MWKEKEKIITTTPQQPPIETKFKKRKDNYRNSNNKNGGAGDRECFWKKQTHKRKETHNKGRNNIKNDNKIIL